MRSLQELENKLTSPNRALIEDLRHLNGDIIILGAGGKMGPSLSILAKRAVLEAGINVRIIAVSRFSDERVREKMEDAGVETISGDLLDESFLQSLPTVENVIFMAGQKFGTSGNEGSTWAMNTYLPGRVGHYFYQSRIVVFSTGNVYPLVPVDSGGATEQTPPGPVGEYAQSCLGRERIFQYFSSVNHTPTVIFRLNYALDLRYGVLNDIARMVWNNQSIDLSMGYVNVIWQGDANSFALRSLLHCSSLPTILNVTGPEVISVEWLAKEFGRMMDRTPRFTGTPAPTALLSNAGEALRRFGQPVVSLQYMMTWTVQWIESGGADLQKPTHFSERKGQF